MSPIQFNGWVKTSTMRSYRFSFSVVYAGLSMLPEGPQLKLSDRSSAKLHCQHQGATSYVSTDLGPMSYDAGTGSGQQSQGMPSRHLRPANADQDDRRRSDSETQYLVPVLSLRQNILTDFY